MGSDDEQDELLKEFESSLAKPKKMKELPKFSAPSLSSPPSTGRIGQPPSSSGSFKLAPKFSAPPLSPSFSRRELKDPVVSKTKIAPREEEEVIEIVEAKEEEEAPSETEMEQLRQILLQRIRAILMSRQTNKAEEMRRLLSAAGGENDSKIQEIVRRYESIVESGQFETEAATAKAEETKKEEPRPTFGYDEREEKRSSIYSKEEEEMRGGLYKLGDKKADNVAKDFSYKDKLHADVDAKEAVEKMKGSYKEEEEEEDKAYRS